MKRIYNILKPAALTAMLLIASSCDDYLDINVSPNNLPTAPIANVLPGAEIATGFYVGNTVQIVSSLWIQHMAGTGTQTDPYDRYNVSPGDFNNEWNLAYSTILDDLQEIINKGREEENFVHAGMAQILQSYVWAVTTDIWGDIPFDQSLNFQEFEKPVYDSQEQIYDALIAKINEGIADLDKGNSATLAASAGDLIYNGDVSKWKRAANSLKLKLLLQSRHKNPDAAAQIAQLVQEDMLITTNANNFNVPFTTSSGSQNPIYQYAHLTRVNDLILSQRFLDSLQATNDPRLPLIATTTNGNYVAYDNGLNAVSPFQGVNNRSRWGFFVVGNGTLNANGTISGAGSAPIRLITASMVHFWLAEAALTLGTPGDAAELYRQALQLNFDNMRTFVTSAPADFATQATNYIDTRIARFNSASSTQAKLNIMIRDKWVASAGNAYEAYNDFRRTGYPNLALAQNAQAGVTRIPTRWPYPLSEIQSNVENVPIQDYPSGLIVPVWWMPQ